MGGINVEGFHAMVYDSARRLTVLYGGARFGGITRDTWEWNGSAWTRRTDVSGVTTLERHAMAYDSARGVTVLFGGWDGKEVFEHTFEYDGTLWRWRNTGTDPPARQWHAMAFDSRRNVTVLFGGAGDRSYTDTWEWNGQAWSQVATTGPSNSGATQMVYDSARGVCVLFVGTFSETWEWDGVQWVQRQTPTAPSSRHSHAMAYDSHRGRTVLFGGRRDSVLFAETWEFGLYPDCDQTTGAGTLDIFDFLCFGNKFANNDPYACNCDTSTGQSACDIFDFLCFQNLFANCQP